MEGYNVQPIDWGNFGTGGIVDTSYDQPIYTDTVTRDIATQSQQVNTSGNDMWSGFLAKTVGQVLDYGIKRDAAQTGVQLQAAQLQAQRGIYTIPGTQTARSPGLTINQLMLIGGLAVAVMLASK